MSDGLTISLTVCRHLNFHLHLSHTLTPCEQHHVNHDLLNHMYNEQPEMKKIQNRMDKPKILLKKRLKRCGIKNLDKISV